MGLPASVPLSDKFGVNCWVVNGTNQVEATNGFKDRLFGFTVKLSTNINWTLHYFPGREQPDHALHKLWCNRRAAGVVLRTVPHASLTVPATLGLV